MRLKKLIENLNYKGLKNINDCEIKGISCNSRSIAPGYLFVAIKGEKLDGHSFINQAIEKGAKAVILQKDLPIKKNVPEILVQDSRAALAYVCAVFFGHPAKNLKLIGITGTNGKTTVSYLIEKILSCAGYSSGVVGTVNYRIGNKVYGATCPVRNKTSQVQIANGVNTTPQADVLQSFLQKVVFAKSKYAIIEVSSHALAQRRVDCIDFSTAIFTNLSQEHLDYHGNLDNYFSCKLSLFERLGPDAFAVINVDDSYGRKLAKKVNSRILSYGIKRPAQVQARNLKLGVGKSQFTVITPRGNIEIESLLIGRHNVYNVLAAISTAVVENINFSHIASGIKAVTSVCGRLERIDCGGDFLVFVDYAHTEDALKKTLQTLRNLNKNKPRPCAQKRGKIILVFGCGGDRDKAKRPKMGRVATELSDSVIITCDNPRSENPRDIISDIIRGIDKKRNNYEVLLDRFQAIRRALSVARHRDIVVIAGKGHESSQIFADRIIPFNDREVVKKILLTNQRF